MNELEMRPMATDPVCGMEVNPEVATAQGLTSEHDGETYYFCGRAASSTSTRSPRSSSTRRTSRTCSGRPGAVRRPASARVDWSAHAPHQHPGADEALPRRRHRARRADRRHRAGRHRPRRRERRGQEHADQDPARPAAGDRGRGAACSTSTRPPHGARIRELVGYMPEHDCLPPDVSATEFVTHMARVSGLPAGRRARADRRRAAPRRAVRGALPADRRLLDRHEAARQAGPGAGPRPAGPVPRRADQRPRPGRPRRDAGAHRAHRPRVRDRRHRGQPPPRRDRARRRLAGRHRRRTAAAHRPAVELHRANRPAPDRDRGGRRRRSPSAWSPAASMRRPTAAPSSPTSRPAATASSRSTTRCATRRWRSAWRSFGSSRGGISSRTCSAPGGTDERVA